MWVGSVRSFLRGVGGRCQSVVSGWLLARLRDFSATVVKRNDVSKRHLLSS